MTGQSTDAAERSTLRAAEQDGTCYVCGGPWKGGASFAARCLPPLVQVCSKVCAALPPFAKAAVLAFLLSGCGGYATTQRLLLGMPDLGTPQPFYTWQAPRPVACATYVGGYVTCR